MSQLLKLMRVPNLLFVMVFQILMRYAVIEPIMASAGITTPLPLLPFLLLLLATFCILGAGYIINGYFDTRIDAINKPDQVIVGRSVSRRLAITLHQVLSLVGVLIGLYLAWYSKKYQAGCSFIFVVGLLWFYSSSYKRQFLIGNVMVALIAGMTLLYVIIFDGAYLLQHSTQENIGAVLALLWTYVLNYALAFALITLILGIIKDQITEPGDRELECHTLPIVWGSRRTKIIVTLLSFFFMAYIGHIYYHGMLIFDTSYIFLRYLLSLVVLPLVVSCGLNIKSRIPKDFQWSYRAAQVVLIGIAAFSILNWYYIVKG